MLPHRKLRNYIYDNHKTVDINVNIVCCVYTAHMHVYTCTLTTLLACTCNRNTLE